MRARKLFRLNKRTYQDKVIFYASFPTKAGWSKRKSTGYSTKSEAEKGALK